MDPAFRRPGRFDRMVFVGLPDTAARASIGRLHLQDRPIEGIDLSALAPLIDWTSHLTGYWQKRFDDLESLLKRMDQ